TTDSMARTTVRGQPTCSSRPCIGAFADVEAPMKRRMLLVVAVMACTWSMTAGAHHSSAATYDLNKDVQLEGKIVQILLRKPHSFLHIEAPGRDAAVQRWSLEWRSIGSLDQQGVKRDTLKVGDLVVITMNPSRTADDHRGVLKGLLRKSDGFGWRINPGEISD